MCYVTLVCCWTNEKMYSDLVKCIESQTIPCKIIGIDNRGNKGFTSCASAYNSVMNQIATKYVIYSHQDIVLNNSGVIEKFVSYISGLGRDDILGVAGVRFDTAGVFANLMHVSRQTGELVPAGRHKIESDIMECDTVDECEIVKRERGSISIITIGRNFIKDRASAFGRAVFKSCVCNRE